MKNKIFTTVFGIAVFFFILSFSIALPIYLRFFYYLHINGLSLPQKIGYSYEQIKCAYDEVLNYLTLPNMPFGTGVFAFTKSGAEHFADCKVLFNINLIALTLSTITIIATFILIKLKKIKLCRPFNMNVAFISAVSIFLLIFAVAIVVMIDFSSAFTTFHHIFFPNKTNWVFDPNEMEIILALPEQFFLNCAILIGSSIFIFCLSIIIYQLVKRKNFIAKK